MHRLDNLDLDIIIALTFLRNELGNSINDRLCATKKNKMNLNLLLDNLTNPAYFSFIRYHRCSIKSG
jgi:hypothetical protein